MACVDSNAIVDYLEGTLSPEDALRIEDHVDACDGCRLLLKELSQNFLVGPNEGVVPEEGVAKGPLRRNERVGRYVLHEWLGAGGMGVVYSAHDPQLDRKVALKFLRPARPARGEASLLDSSERKDAERLLREAKALARVSHRNVVGIYDAGIHRDRIFIVMEFVEGRTLADWLEESPRPVHEILAIFLQAGRGLAAAHAVGLVHRDFKPTNVLVGRDGIARVTDFGLAREPSVSPPTSSTSDGPRTPVGTSEGLAGTPAYMAPEQRDGRATMKSDQFSFSLALSEALDGASPLWVRAKLARGLRPDPDERYPSMEALLLALSRDPRQIAWRWGRWAIAMIVGALTVGLFARVELRESTICSGAEDELAGVWDDSRRRTVETAFLGTAMPYAEETWQRTKATLDAYAASWVAMHTDTCKATHVRKEQSRELLDLRMNCLDERLRDLRATTDLFTRADATTVEKAVMIAQSLRRIDGCADTAALRSGVSVPVDPNVRAKMEAVATSLARARVLEQASKLAEASVVVRHAIDEAHATQQASLSAEATLLLGVIELAGGRAEQAVSAFDAAIALADRAHDDRTRARAWIELVTVFGYHQVKYAEAARAAGFAEAAIERIGGDVELRALLEDHLGSVDYRQGEYASARRHMQASLDLLTAIAPAGDVRVAEALYHLALQEGALGHPDEALALAGRALEIWQVALGASHPKVAFALNHQAVQLENMSRHEDSLGFAERALAIWENGQPPVLRLVGVAEANIGIALDGLEQHQAARVHLMRAVELNEQTFGPSHLETAIVLSYLARTLRHLGRFEEAVDLDMRALTIWQPKDGPPHPNCVGALLGLGESYLGLGQPKRAIEPLEHGIAIEASLEPGSFDLARMRLTLARALWDSRGDPERAKSLAMQARDRFLKGPGHVKDLAEADTWISTHEPRSRER